MKHDLLHIQGKPFVLVPLHEYRALTADGQDNENELPEDVLDVLSTRHDNPIRVLRRFRGLTQQELAEAAGLSRPYLTEMEKGRKSGSLRAMKALAEALSVHVRYLMA